MGNDDQQKGNVVVDNEGFGEDHVSMMVPINAGKARVKRMISEFRPSPIIKSWRIVMDFDQDGELISCWESSLDKDGNEVIGGGISRSDDTVRDGTITCKGFRLSPLQIDALLAGLEHKMARSALGWLCDINGRDEPTLLFRMVTIRSLHKRGLLDGNFTDMRVHDGDSRGVKNLDGAVHEHCIEFPKTPKFQVWTSDLGKELLKEVGLLPDGTETLH